MPKINQEEYEVLKELDDKYKWIARDEDRGLYALTKKPVKKDGPSSYWWDADPYSALGLIDEIHLFQFIQWEDESPYNIQGLIEEYLYDNQPKLFIDGQEQSFEFIEESEETEVKSKQELIEKWESAIEAAEFYGKGKEDRLIEYMRNFVDDLNRLDEPEVLSQKWISENVEYAYFDMLDGSGRLSSATAIIKPENLQNLLVPKQKLPVIPNYVAKWISEHHEKFDLYPALRRLEEGSTRDYDTYKWYRANTLKFVNAYLTGKYKVEEEQKYYVLSKDRKTILLERWASGISPCAMPITEVEEGDQLTEQEIKDYDERYWPFAVKVEELEA